jgi:dCTP diphosphatase
LTQKYGHFGQPGGLELNLQQLQARLRDFADDRDWGQFHTPKNLAMALAAEVGELLEVFQWLTDEQSVNLRDSDDELMRVAEELADILIYVARLADVLAIDMDSALDSKLHTNEAKYPVEISKGTAVKYNRRA